MYEHSKYPPASEYIKYKGPAGQIDIVDSIINILSNNPGLDADNIFLLIYPPHMVDSKDGVN